ncbi:uncharacterized protein LOC130551332, partial [Triplophysa rosa]|uniref:uncharacterized protein LOC130551332 n=1 Tax=Triplophysa rosa TaxID=992332 RepID=UPI002545FF74
MLKMQTNNAVRVKFRDSKKFIFSSQPFTFQTFLECVAKKCDLPTINVKVFDDSKTEVDEEAFEYLLTQPNLGVLKMIIPGTASLDEILVHPHICTHQDLAMNVPGTLNLFAPVPVSKGTWIALERVFRPRIYLLLGRTEGDPATPHPTIQLMDNDWMKAISGRGFSVVKVDGIGVCQFTSIDEAFITAFSNVTLRLRNITVAIFYQSLRARGGKI